MATRIKKTRKLLGWLALNGAMMWCGWEAVVNGHVNASRLFVFASWWFGASTFLGGHMKEFKAKTVKQGLSVPYWMAGFVDLAVIPFLVWHGWWWTAIAWVLMALGTYALYDTEGV